jgi:hypothetical protein
MRARLASPWLWLSASWALSREHRDPMASMTYSSGSCAWVIGFWGVVVTELVRDWGSSVFPSNANTAFAVRSCDRTNRSMSSPKVSGGSLTVISCFPIWICNWRRRGGTWEGETARGGFAGGEEETGGLRAGEGEETGEGLAKVLGAGAGAGAGEEEGVDSLDCVEIGVMDLPATFLFSRPSNSDALPFRIEKNCGSRASR